MFDEKTLENVAMNINQRMYFWIQKKTETKVRLLV